MNETSIALVGMCKNAGKTTVLNCLLEKYAKSDSILGITSIGRDGEAVDVVTGTKKPRIYIPAGTLYATAAGLLKNCDVTSEILKTTGIDTPLGEVILLRAVSDGYVDLAGPSMNKQLEAMKPLFCEYGVDVVLIDGAISRKSLCSPKVTKSVVLCTGASYHKSMQVVIEDTAYISELLQLKCLLKEEEKLELCKCRSNARQGEKFSSYDTEISGWKHEKGSLADILRENPSCEKIYIDGAFTDAVLKPVLLSNVNLKGKLFVVSDSSKILLSKDSYRKLQQKGAYLSVCQEICLLAVAVNPFSAYGNHFEKERFKEQMQQAVQVPVINVLEDDLPWS